MHYDVIIIGGGPGGFHGGERTGGRRQKSRHHRRQTLGRHVPELRLHPHQDAPRRNGPPRAPQGSGTPAHHEKGSIDIDYKALQTRVGRFLKGSSQTLAKSLAAAGITLYEGRGVCAGKGGHRPLRIRRRNVNV